MENIYRILFSSGGKELLISPEGNCRLIEGGLSGFDCTGFDVRINSYAGGVGGYASKRRFAQRELSVTFEILGGGAESDAIRRHIVSMMDPRLDGVLEVTLYGVTRKIGVIPSGECEFIRSVLSDSIEATLSFAAPAVFFDDSEDSLVLFRSLAPALTFPLNLMSGAGTVSGMYRTTDEAAAENSGDGECGIVCTIRAFGGSIVNPGIKLGNDFVRCPVVLEDGHELIIDTRQRQKNIMLDGERYFNFDRGSVFFALPAGISVVKIICDSGGEYIDAKIEFTEKYFGF